MNTQNKNIIIKLLICYHKPYKLLQDEILTPIHVGRALARKRMDTENSEYQWFLKNMIGDDTGDNISEKNDFYNELTSLYWAWKNYNELGNPDYIGMMHYRRHFILHENEIDVVSFDGMNEHYFDEINYSPEKLQELLRDCDFVAHIGKVNNIYKHYLENHRREDLDTVLDILYKLYPEYKEIAEEYFAGNLSNFCNMFIFSRELFFNYCEWIFSILEEFEKRIDTRNKRFFISERLTGVYIAKQMKDRTRKYKVVPISFISENITIPLLIPYEKSVEFQIATTILSLLKNKKESSKYLIYLLCETDIEAGVKEKFEKLVSAFTECKIQFFETKFQPEYYPLILAELFPKLKKCIWLTEDVLILKDLTEFYRTCGVDDYFVAGVPLGDYNIYETDKKVQLSFLVMNLSKLRQLSLFENIATEIKTGKDATMLFNKMCRNAVGYVPWYYITVTGSLASGIHLFDKKRTRGQLQADAMWKPVMLYDENIPWENPQDVFSLFWWEMASFVPVSFKFPDYNRNVLQTVFAQQQQEINEIGTGVRKLHQSAPVPETEDWRSYSLIGKLKYYYKHNGFKKTVQYCCRKYILREK